MKTTKKLFALLLSLLLILNLSSCNLLFPKPEPPKIKHGEFPFELVCEVNGEEISFKDTLVIEYTGSYNDFEVGEHYTWDTSFLNSAKGYHKNFYEILLKEGYKEEVGDYEICFYIGHPEYYMGIEELNVYYEFQDIYPGDVFIRTYYTGPIDEETLYEEYHVKIIKKSISEPLVDNIE